MKYSDFLKRVGLADKQYVGLSHEMSNEGAIRFMGLCFGVDTA
jgi:hypothetical protein